MKRSFFGTAAVVVAAALWLGTPASHSIAQSVVDSAVDASSSTAAGSSSSTGVADTATDASTEASTSAQSANAPSTVTSPSSDTASVATGQTDNRSEAQPQADADATATPSAAASASSDAQTRSTESSIQAGASTDNDADATQPDNATPRAASTDATLQGQAGVDASTQVGVQQNLETGLQFGQATDRGLAINTIARESFFYDNGIRRGDVLVSYGGRPIRSQADFRRWVVYRPGQRVPVIVLREGRPQTIYVTYRQRGPGFENEAGYSQSPSGAYLGVSFDPQYPTQSLIRAVNPGSPAERAGLRPGDVIVALNGNRIGGSQDVIRTVASMQPGEPLDVAVSRQVVLGSRPGVAQTSYAPETTYQDSSTTTQAVPSIPTPQAGVGAAVDTGAYVGRDAATGGQRFDNTPARAGDADRDGRLLDADGRVGPAEGRAVLPRRRN